MHYDFQTCAAILGGCAVVTLGALSVGLVDGQPAPTSASGTTKMLVGDTSTETTPSNAPAVGKAEPAIKGPAK